MFWRSIPTRAWLFGLFLMVGLSIAYYLVLGLGAKTSVTEQFLRRKQTLARAEASNIVSYFRSFGNSVAVLSKLSSIEQGDKAKITQDMDTFVEERRDSGKIGGVVLTDREGIVKFNSNVTGIRDVGISLADRDYFVWAKSEPKEAYFIGQPVVSRLGGSKGQMIVPVAAPVYKQGVFAGVIAASVKLKPLTERYLGLLKISDTTSVYLIGHEGNLLYKSSVPDVVGSNIFELSQGESFTGNKISDDLIKNILSKTEEGSFDTGEYLIAYSPVVLGSQNWTLVMVSPSEEVSELTKPFYVRQTSMLLLTFLTTVLFGIVVAQGSKDKGKEVETTNPVKEKPLQKG